MHRPLSAGVQQSVHFVNNGLQISLSAPVQKTTAHKVRQSVHFVNNGLQISMSAGAQKTTAHKVNVRRRSATGKLFDA